LTQKGKGVDEHLANKGKMDAQLQETQKREAMNRKRIMELEAQLRDKAKDSANKLQLMVLKEKNKIQDVKLKEFQSLIQNQDFKINVLSSKLAIYKHRNDKINGKEDSGEGEDGLDAGDYAAMQKSYQNSSNEAQRSQHPKFKSVNDFVDVDVE